MKGKTSRIQEACYFILIVAGTVVFWREYALTGGTEWLTGAILMGSLLVLLPTLPTISHMYGKFSQASACIDRRIRAREITNEQALDLMREALENIRGWYSVCWPYYWLAVAPRWKRLLGY